MTNLTNKIKLSEGAILAAIPVVFYALGFSYEAGYLNYYGIPDDVISIDATAMISATIFGALYSFILFLWLSIAVDSSLSDSSIEKAIGITMPLGIIIIIFFIVKGDTNIAFLSSFGFMAAIVFLRWLESKSVIARKFFTWLYNNVSTFFDYDEKPPQKKSAFKLLQDYSAIAILFALPFFLAFAAGSNNAKSKTEYDTIQDKTHNKLALIRIYGEKIITIPLSDKDQHNLPKKRYVIIPTQNLDNVTFEKEDIGKITFTSESKKPNK